MFCEDVILQEIAVKESTRDNIALTYAFCIISSEEIDFRKINIAIAERWSRSAVNYIKHKAWRTVKQKTIAIPAQDSKGNNSEQSGHTLTCLGFSDNVTVQHGLDMLKDENMTKERHSDQKRKVQKQ